MAGKRLAAAHARISEHPDVAWWLEYFTSIAASDFLMGRTPRDAAHANWRPTIDWALTPSSVVKVQSGNYSNRKLATLADARSAEIEAWLNREAS